MATSRFCRVAVSALRASRSHTRLPVLSRAVEVLSSVSCTSFPARSANGFPVGEIRSSSPLNGVGLGGGFASSYTTAATSGQINNSEFTEMAWEGLTGAVEAARATKQQVVETEHLMKALLEQKDGLARRIFTKAGLDNTSVLQATEEFISQQPKVTGDTSGPILSSNLSSLLDAARKHKREMGDSFVSVEHLLLAFTSDKRFGQMIFRNLQLSEKSLTDAVNAVRGSQRVTDQSMC